MKKTVIALAALAALTTACSEEAGSIEEFDMTDNEVSAEEVEAYEEAQSSDDVATWLTSLGMEVPADLEVIEDGVAVSESERTVYALSCARAAELTEEEGAEYGPRWENDEAVMGYATVCRD